MIPAIEALRARFDVPLSVDTWRASVLREALAAGAVVGNDISGFADPDYLPVAAAAGASVVATHIRIGPACPTPSPSTTSRWSTRCARFLRDRAEAAEAAGIPRERVMVDAGLDLGKTEPQSLELLRGHDRLAALGWPLFLSASNKRFLGDLRRHRRSTTGARRATPPTRSASRSAAGSSAPTTCAAPGAPPT